jgi:F420-dependent oxidoreductase-like protein
MSEVDERNSAWAIIWTSKFRPMSSGLRALEGSQLMRISMQLNYAGDFHSSLSQVLEYEREGLDILWVAEAYGLDSPTLMGYLAAKTTSLQIGSAILPIFTRTPALIAQTAAGLDEVSQGRALLGLGASGPQVIEGWHGVRYDKPLQRTREIVEVCRKVWSREYLQNDGIYQIPLPLDLGTGLGKLLKLITHPIRSRIPIYIDCLLGTKEPRDDR